MRTLITIDPGLSGTGLAIWSADLMGNILNHPPLKVFSIRHNGAGHYLAHFQHLIKEYCCADIICEDADYRKSAKGEMVAQSGDLVTLAKFIGMIQGLGFCNKVPVELVSANVWKGQLNKKKVVERLKKIWPASTNFCGNEEKAHDWEAVGIGFWKQGKF